MKCCAKKIIISILTIHSLAVALIYLKSGTSLTTTTRAKRLRIKTEPIEKIANQLFYFDAITDYDTIKRLNYIFNQTIQLLIKNNITYWVLGGTLMSAVKNKGNLAWDDDHDICLMAEDLKKFMAIQNQFRKINLVYSKGIHGRLSDLKRRVVSRMYKYLFIDIFIFFRNKNVIDLLDLKTNRADRSLYFKNNYFYYDDLFPLKKYQYEDYEINGPNNPFEYLNRSYPNWQNTGKSQHHIRNKNNNVNKMFPTFYYQPNIKKTFLWLINTNNINNYESVKKYCSNTFEIIEIDQYLNKEKYLPELKKLQIEDHSLEDNIISIILMYKYGGLFIDCASVLVLSELDNILNKLKLYEFVSFGCSQNENEIGNECKQMSGSIMASRPKRVLTETVLKKMITVIFYQNEYDKYRKYKNIHEIIIWQEINGLIKRFGYEYYHYSTVTEETDKVISVYDENRQSMLKIAH